MFLLDQNLRGVTLGDTFSTPNDKVMLLTGAADAPSVLSSINGVESELRAYLTGLGWRINSLSVKIAGYSGTTCNIAVQIQVADNWTDDDVRTLLNGDIENYQTSNYIFSNYKFFSNVDMRVVSSSFKAKTGNNIQGQDNPGGSNDPNAGKTELEKFWDNIKTELGVSATTAIVVGGVFLVVMLKER